MNNKIIFNTILSFSIFALIAAYYIQYILGHEPCNLCLFERIPYILATIITTFAFITNKFEKTILALLGIIFIFSTILSFYHFGIEEGFFKESLVCDLNNETINLSKEDLLKKLKETTVSCKEVTFKIFGFSLSTLNIMVSFVFSFLILKNIINYKNKKKN